MSEDRIRVRFEPIQPDDIKTDEHGRVLDKRPMFYGDSEKVEVVPLKVYGQGILVWEPEFEQPVWRSPKFLWWKVEQPEQREPLGFFYVVERGDSKGNAMRLDFYWSDIRLSKSEAIEFQQDVGGKSVRRLCEVLPPEVKELPDSEGVWWNWSSSYPFRVYRDDQGKLGYDTATGYHHSGVKGRWIKIEKPDFGGSDE